MYWFIEEFLKSNLILFFFALHAFVLLIDITREHNVAEQGYEIGQKMKPFRFFKHSWFDVACYCALNVIVSFCFLAIGMELGKHKKRLYYKQMYNECKSECKNQEGDAEDWRNFIKEIDQRAKQKETEAFF